MTSPRFALAMLAALTFSGAGAAQAQSIAAGDYTLAVGHSAPCSVKLTADGSADGTACAVVGTFNRWHQVGSTVQLTDNSGTLFGVLRAKGGTYVGSAYATSASLTLTPASQTAASH